jgi:hypothetical protein
MQKLIVYLFLFASLFATRSAIAQSASVKGNISDTLEKKTLSNAVVLLLRKSDSIMVKFTRTDKAGDFVLKNLPAGDFLLMISYPAYADYVDEIHLKDSVPANLQTIGMIRKSQLLKEVVVTGNKGAIHIKGDTTEYKADSFKVQQGASVEELLKKLPGIQVDRNGKITAQGQAVQKVLVDGEEFFGDDPTLVTQNLRADMVDKVQVYDKKSDQAAFTGIDDGQRTKTINLKLKDNKKNGYFGKIDAGAGTDGYYNYQLMANLFKKKQKLGVYGIASNTGKTGLNWQENNNYGQSFASSAEYDENMGYYTFSGNQDDLDSWNGQYNGQGYPTVKTGGIHYNNKWDDDRQSINGNYKILQLQVNNTNGTNSQYILPDTLYYNNQTEKSNNKILRNRINSIYEFQFDSTSSLKINIDGGTDHKTTSSEFKSEALSADSALVNRSTRTVSTVGDNNKLNSNLLWRKKLRKKGRTISVNLKENYTRNASDGFLYANNEFFSSGSTQIIDQYKNFKTENVLLDSRITYTEPISPYSSLIANYGISVDNSSSNRNSFNKASNGKYEQIDSLYSNDYQFNVFTQTGGLSYNLVKRKLRLNAGSNIGFTNFNQTDVHENILTKRNFVNWYPGASMVYSFTQQNRLGLRYQGHTTQPTIQQIQPIQDNEDPLNISIGNPDLKPQFSNSISLFYNDYKVLTERYIYGNISFDFTQDAISSSDYIDSSGKKTYQAVNISGNRSINAWMGYSFKWKKAGIDIGFNPSFSNSRNVNIVNNVLNVTNSGNYTFGINLNKFKEKKYSIGFSSSATYTRSKSSVQANIKTSYWTYNLRPEAEVFLPLKFQVHTDLDINLRQKTSVFDYNTNVVLWNAWLGKKFLKNDALLVKVSANDLLNRNIGFNRTVNSNYISQNTYSSIQRYFLFSVVWNFNKAGTPAPKD